MTATREQFVAAARGLLGTRYAHQGRTRNAVDCVGLVLLAALESGVLSQEQFDAVPRDYRAEPDGQLVALLHQHCQRLATVNDAELGDLLAVKYRDEPQHLMIIERATRWGWYVFHAVAENGVINHLANESYFRSRNATPHAAFRLVSQAQE